MPLYKITFSSPVFTVDAENEVEARNEAWDVFEDYKDSNDGYPTESNMQVVLSDEKSLCPNCDSEQLSNDIEYLGDQKYECPNCKKNN